LGFAQEVRLTRQIDPADRVVLTPNVHPLALAGTDLGKVSDTQMLRGMVVEFRRTPQQQAELEQLLIAQQDRKSADYHRWFTPEQFRARFGVATADVDAVQHWLENDGFQIEEASRSGTYVRFSGTAQQVTRSFSPEIHWFLVRGERHFAPASAVTIPAALSSLIYEIRNLDSFRPHSPLPKTRALYVWGGSAALAPGDLATIYDFQSLRAAGNDGTGQTVAVVGQTDIALSDLALYRSSFGLPAANIRVITAGADPGVSPDDVYEANLDLDVVSAVAPNALLLFVNATNVIDSVQYAIDQDLAPVISMSYAVCEPEVSALPLTSAMVLQSWAQQANAEGITWIAASGDSGPAGCDPFGYGAPYATQGLAVNLPASIPEVTGVGGTQFAVPSNSYWGAQNGLNGGTAVSYVPENAWNDNETTEPGASGGGASIDFFKPSWQVGLGVPNDNARDVPDVAFAASPLYAGYVIAVNGQLTTLATGPDGAFVVGGTSGAAPLFAGIVALLNEYLAASLPAQPGQGNINPTLYSLAQTSTDVFHDITQGNNLWYCAFGSPDCIGQLIGYYAGPGYDQVTGLGSVDAYNLLHQWPGSQGQPPTAVTGLAAVTYSLTGYNAAMTGTVNPNGKDTLCQFVYGTNSGLTGAIQTPGVDVGSGSAALSCSASVRGLPPNTAYYYQLASTNANGSASGSISSFSTHGTGPLPAVTIGPASSITANAATLGGTVNPEGLDTHYTFLYGTSSSLTVAYQTASVDIGSGSTPSPANVNISGLAANTVYYFRMQASNSAGAINGLIASFTTSSGAQAPAVTTLPASAITQSGAALGGTVNPNSLDTHYWFSYGTSSTLSSSLQTSSIDAGSGSGQASASAAIAGLALHTTYYFQLNASNSAGSKNGAILSFITSQPSAVSTGAASAVTTTSASLGGTVNPNGIDTRYWFVYSSSVAGSNASETITYDSGSGSQPVSVSVPVTGLVPNTTYAFQLLASNSAGAISGSVSSFTTNAAGTLPSVTTGLASNITGSSATISGSLTPNGNDTHYWFLYGTSPTLTFANQTNKIDAGSGTSIVAVSANVTGLSSGTYYYQLQALSSAGANGGSISSFYVPGPPIVSTGAYLPEPGGSATFTGQVNNGRTDTQYWFLYGTNPTLSGASQTPSTDLDTGSTSSVTVSIIGLSPGTTYYFRLQASNAYGLSSGSILSFTANLPVAITSPATFGAGGWTLWANVTPNGLPTSSWFLYGTSPTLSGASQTYKANPGSTTSTTTETVALTSLLPNTTYYFQAVASSSAATVSGSILSFATVASAMPTVTVAPATAISGAGATLTGTVTPNALDTRYDFLYGTSSSLSSPLPTTVVDLGSGVAPVPVSAALTGLGLGVTYYYQIQAWNSFGTTTSQILSFATAGAVPPAITSLSPDSTRVGGGAFTLTINGTNFVPGATATWGTTALTTTFVSSVELTAAVPASLLARPGGVSVTVTTTGGTTAGATFIVRPL
jgi:phosphodiesterase/alkaline phosphatase D-like protein